MNRWLLTNNTRKDTVKWPNVTTHWLDSTERPGRDGALEDKWNEPVLEQEGPGVFWANVSWIPTRRWILPWKPSFIAQYTSNFVRIIIDWKIQDQWLSRNLRNDLVYVLEVMFILCQVILCHSKLLTVTVVGQRKGVVRATSWAVNTFHVTEGSWVSVWMFQLLPDVLDFQGVPYPSHTPRKPTSLPLWAFRLTPLSYPKAVIGSTCSSSFSSFLSPPTWPNLLCLSVPKSSPTFFTRPSLSLALPSPT